MTTIAQVRKVIAPLLERHSDLALVGREIYIKPIHHFARVVLIDRMLDPDLFRPQWAVAHLFEARQFLPLSWGAWIHNTRSNTPGIWSIHEPDVSAAMVEAIETQALPVLRGIVSLEDYLAFVSGHFFRHHLFDWPHVKIIVDVARGDLDAARALRDANVDRFGDDPAYDDEGRAKYRRIRELCARLEADDRPGLAALLHEWEAITVRNLKIETLWEPTPFPLELEA
ncbi:hypothetical protein PQJ75_05485 [Rhodoplanes sp. TEM]|uniref:DUF4375 domain-containing protein n=1 Tax=Rhodoplanes tepidamans TaxID=200616 RepID=A0ABT5J307_RHOTP|nr:MULTISPECIES: hypothetical protein [Rhodoplanes]MDC7784080.1 hypothetical protein [Rhodoplanes tepidamans]MDC7983175.1 hypothetical protein [Rhodoplanes sp. TEM]MDQ0356824.1 hypothetical protein [Rhodoplanes tepidamans]